MCKNQYGFRDLEVQAVLGHLYDALERIRDGITDSEASFDFVLHKQYPAEEMLRSS